MLHYRHGEPHRSIRRQHYAPSKAKLLALEGFVFLKCLRHRYQFLDVGGKLGGRRSEDHVFFIAKTHKLMRRKSRRDELTGEKFEIDPGNSHFRTVHLDPGEE